VEKTKKHTKGVKENLRQDRKTAASVLCRSLRTPLSFFGTFTCDIFVNTIFVL